MKVYLPGYVDFPATKNLTFDAELTIEIEVVERTKQIVLNWKELNISEDSSVSVDKKIVAIEKIDCDKNLEKVTFYLEKYLLPGNEVLLTIVYTGPIGDTLGGLYRSHYVDADGKPKISAVSQMEPTDARMMVPCFDEPQFKANWTVTIAHPKGTRAISNGMEIDSKEDDDWVETTFSTTPRMSSYLLAVFISEFVYIEGATKSGTTFRIWSRPEAKDQTQYALEFGIKALEYYEELYGIPFPLSKQDMVALPDFSAGAMENWGLVTYRENLLLYDPALYPPIRKRTVAMVVAHELAHQWFGNLVTMEWWEDLWLNEGFASFLEYFGTDKISDGKFRMTESFLSEAQDTSFFPDSFATSHPLSFKIGKAEEVSEAFDAISYSKGASVIHMIRSVMTPNNFDNGIKFYLRSHSFSNAQASDLWSALGKFVGNATLGADGKKLDVPSFARQWTTQMGYPILTVTRQNKGSVVLEQSRFKFSNETEEAMKYRFPEYKFKWDVPVWYKTPKDSQSKFTWVARDASTTLPVDPDDYILLNYDSIGFYRVNYDKIGWELIARQLEKDHTQISSNTRYRLISDAFTLAEAGQLDYETVFDLSRYLEHEDEYMPWTAVIDGFKGMASYFGTEPEAQYVKAFVRRLLEPLYKNARVDHIDSHYLDDNQFFESLLETDVISAYCEQDDIGCNSLLNERFSKDLLEKCNGTEMSSKCSKVVVPLRSRIYCIGIENGDRTVWNRVFDLYRQESVQQERNSLLTSLTCSRDITTLKNILLMTLDRKSKHIRLQDAPMVWATVASNPVGMSFMLDFLMDRWTMIYESLNDNMTLLRGVIEHCTQNMRTEREIKQLTEFMAEHPETRNIQVFQNEIATAHNRVNWLARNFQPLSDYFKSLDNKIF